MQETFIGDPLLIDIVIAFALASSQASFKKLQTSDVWRVVLVWMKCGEREQFSDSWI